MSSFDTYQKYYGIDSCYPNGITCPICKVKLLKEAEFIGHMASHVDDTILDLFIRRNDDYLYGKSGYNPLYDGYGSSYSYYSSRYDLVYHCLLCGLDVASSREAREHVLRKHTFEVAKITAERLVDRFLKKEDEIKTNFSEQEALSKLEKACDGDQSVQDCSALVGLKLAGWTVDKSPAINADGRKGFIITVLEPIKKGDTNVQSHSESDKK